jgi:hypothetical protein
MVHRGEIAKKAVRASGHKLNQLALKKVKRRGSPLAFSNSSYNLNITP